MSINKAHAAGGGVVLFFGERLLIFYDGCEIKFTFDQAPQLNTTAKGCVYLTSHRTICMCKTGPLQSVAMPLLNMKQVEVKQPIFGANKIEGKVAAEPDGGFTGMGHFSVTFNKGGAIEFAQCLLEAGRRANENRRGFQAPPPYTSFDPNQLYCPPPAQYAPDGTVYAFVPAHEAFAQPPQSSIFVSPAPPPYPGVAPPPPYPQQQQQQQMQTAYYNSNAPHYAHTQQQQQQQQQPSAPPAYEEAVGGAAAGGGKQHAA